MLEGDEHSPLSLELFLLGGFPLAARVPVNLQQKLEAALEILQLSAACSLHSQGAHCSLQNLRHGLRSALFSPVDASKSPPLEML